MKKAFFSATFALFFTANVQAVFTFTPQKNNDIGLYLGSQIWQSDASGTFGEKSSIVDFNLNKQQQINDFIAVEHHLPLLPNVRISSTSLDTTGKNTLTHEFNFAGETFATGDSINASFNVSYVDYTLYYGLFNNPLFSFDLGLTARDFNGAVTIKGPTITEGTEPDRNGWHESCYDENGELKGDCSPGSGSSSTAPTSKIKTDEIEPMLYVATNISLPLPNLSIFAQGDFSFVDDHSISDYQAGLHYGLINNNAVNLNLSLGYRAVKIEFEDFNNLYTNLEFKGAFVGIIAHF